MQTAALPARKVIRELVLVGEDGDPGRRGSKEVIAISRCRFACPDDATLDRCVDAIRKSDEHLRNRPEEMMKWDWQNTFVERPPDPDVEGGDVLLGVAWYDEGFFATRREAHLNPAHVAMYAAIGLPKGAITVSHWRAEGSYTF